VRPLVTAEHVHGKTGLDGIRLADPVMPCNPQHGVDFIIDTLRAEPAGTVTLCPLGPLTNIATAFQRAPDIIPRVQQIVLMGGAYFEVGNITPAAEFNIYVDPEAADIVFKSGVPLVVMPLDVTHKALTNRARVEAFRALGTPGRHGRRMDRFLRTLRHGQIRQRRRPPARPLRDRLSDPPRPLHRPPHQRGDRDRLASSPSA
jgi:purine nucleosidase